MQKEPESTCFHRPELYRSRASNCLRLPNLEIYVSPAWRANGQSEFIGLRPSYTGETVILPKGVAVADELLLRRLLYDAQPEAMEPIPWPKGFEPTYGATELNADGSLPEAKVLVVTWTAAEFRGLADVLTPGHPKEDWSRYTHDFSDYTSRLTMHSPAHDADCLGEFAMTTIAGTTTLCFHSELHLGTDGSPPPIVDLWRQIISEVSPDLVITTGTAGGIGGTVSLGDVFVVSNAKFNCTQDLKDQSWSQKRFVESPSPVPTGGTHLAQARQLVLTNSGRLNPVAIHRPEIGFGGDVETADNPAFANTVDSLGVAKNDPDAHTIEMDDATLPLALSQSPTLSKQRWLSIRNVSDPQVNSSIGNLNVQRQWAFDTYTKYGYWTTIGSAITCWGVIANL